jgi:hypothetical protein
MLDGIIKAMRNELGMESAIAAAAIRGAVGFVWDRAGFVAG